MIAQLICNDCHSENTLLGYTTRNDLKYTKLAHLLETKLKTDDDFEKWYKEKLKDGSAYYKEDKLIIDGEEILDEFQRWEQSDCKCPGCGIMRYYTYTCG